MNENYKCRFDYRFEKKLFEKLKDTAADNGLKTNQLIRNALRHAVKQYRIGQFHFRKYSDFLVRVDRSDLKRFHIILRRSEKEKLIKLAFTMRLSQAEVLRVIMEYYLYVVLGQNGEISKIYKQKCCHDTSKFTPMVVVYSIGRVIEHHYNMIHAPPHYDLQFSSR